MPGIYIHIPFCRQACHYCDFHFSTSLKTKFFFLSALKKEISLQQDYLSDKNINTIYFGGGTPSILTCGEIDEIVLELSKYFSITREAEITLEANPDDLSIQQLKSLSLTPVNRLSIGIQSFSNEDLIFLNRIHSSETAIRSVKDAQQAGFENITIDLIYGIHTLSNEQWKSNISQALSLKVPHISCYSLTVEPKTALASFIRKKKISTISQEKSAEQFGILMKEMSVNNFIHYEISNFCREGFYSKHNSSYWRGEHYLGLGPSAHSFNGHSRQWNVSNNATYIKSIEENKLFFESEGLSENQRYNEVVLTALRTIWGIDTNDLKNRFGNAVYAHFLKESRQYLDKGMLFTEKSKVFLTDDGKFFADKIASDLFLV